MPVELIRKKSTKNLPSKEEEKPVEVIAAEKAVAQYEEARETYNQLMEQFLSTYPEAASELQNVKEFGDQVLDAISKAKRAVAAAKTSIGEFTCQRKFRKAGFDPDLVVQICVDTGDEASLFDIFKAGIVKNISFDSDAAALYFDGKNADKFTGAWKDKEEMTPAITVPKFAL